MVTAPPEGHVRLVGRSEVFVSEGGGAAGEIGAGLKEDLTYVLKDVRPVFLTTPIFLPFSFPTQRDIVWATTYPLNTLSSTISSSSKRQVGDIRFPQRPLLHCRIQSLRQLRQPPLSWPDTSSRPSPDSPPLRHLAF